MTLIFLTVLTAYAGAQAPASDTSLTGTWKGTSICQVKNSRCHDETVVYYITRAEGTDLFNISASKIINGQELDMGILECKLDRKNNRLLSTSGNNVWTFHFRDKTVEGTLYSDGVLYRIVKLARAK